MLRGHDRRAAGERHPHRAAPGRPGVAEAVGAHAVRRAGGARRRHPQPAGRRRRHPARRAGRRHRGGRARARARSIHGSVSGRDGVVAVDQGAIRGSRRSNPATYTGLLEPIRKAFAKANGVKPALFSANSEGACPTCNGAGRHLHRPGR